MKTTQGLALLLPLLLSYLAGLAQSRSLYLNTCTVTVHTNELRKYYTAIRADLIAADSEIGVRLLDTSAMKGVQETQRCCFLRLLLRFYVDRVFTNFASAQPEHQRCASALANAFVSIRRDLHQCHCHCEENTHQAVDTLHTEFIKLDVSKAALKAVGELDVLLDWIDQQKHSTSG